MNRERVDDTEREPKADQDDKRPDRFAPRRMLAALSTGHHPPTGTSGVKGATVDAASRDISQYQTP
jgi:hypothetical protein